MSKSKEELAEILAFYKREDINVNRQKNIDYAKALAILGMILIHVLMNPLYAHLDDSCFGFVARFVLGGVMAAPVFMVSMGLGFAYTKHNNPKDFICRGIKLIILNYVLNILKCFYAIFGIAIHSDQAATSVLYYLLSGDILLFAGLSMIAFGLFNYIKKHKEVYMLITAIVLFIISSVFKILDNTNVFLAYSLGLLITVSLNGQIVIYFPFCEWFIFVVFGYLFAITVKKIKKPDIFYIVSLFVGLICILVPLILYLCGIGEHYIPAPLDAGIYTGFRYFFVSIGAALIEFSLFYFLGKITPETLDNQVFKLSNLVNEIYIVSWVLISEVSFPIILNCFGNKPTVIWPYFVSFIIILPLSIFLASVWKNKKSIT